MFQFAGYAPLPLAKHGLWPSVKEVTPFGNPRIKSCLPLPRGLSQAATSFIAFLMSRHPPCALKFFSILLEIHSIIFLDLIALFFYALTFFIPFFGILSWIVNVRFRMSFHVCYPEPKESFLIRSAQPNKKTAFQRPSKFTLKGGWNLCKIGIIKHILINSQRSL